MTAVGVGAGVDPRWRWRRVPGSHRLLVHPASGRAARPVRALSGASDWRRELLDRVGTGWLGLVGADRLPTGDDPCWPAASGVAVCAELEAALPGLRVLGAVVPRQAGRPRLSILGRMRGNLVVVKLGDDDERLAREASALRRLTDRPLPGIATPDVLESGRLSPPAVAGAPDERVVLTYLVTTSISLRRQRPAIDEPLRTFERDLGERLDALERPHGDDAVVPVHGDLTPWNLRRTARGLALFDWEEVGWGLPGTDLAHYRAACDEVRRRWSRGPGHRPTIGDARTHRGGR